MEDQKCDPNKTQFFGRSHWMNTFNMVRKSLLSLIAANLILTAIVLSKIQICGYKRQICHRYRDRRRPRDF
jgi:hypothetical protein